MNAEETAAATARKMQASDEAGKLVGIALDEVRPGYARMSLTVEKRHTQALGVCHGGMIFMLADAAFAYACNSHGAPAATQHSQVSFLAPARAGDILTAEARERHRKGRSGLYDVDIVNQDGEIVAVMRGAARLVGAGRG